MLNICRSCLQEGSSQKYFCLLSNQLYEIFADLTSLKILENDATTKICLACKEKLEDFDQFKKTCIQSDITLKVKYEDYENDDADTASAFEDTKILKEMHKRKSYTHQSDLIDKSKNPKPAKPVHKFITENGITKYPCRFCKRKFVRLKSVENHEEKHKQKKSIICDLCGAVLINQQSLKSHKRYKHSDERPFPCEQCNLSFKSRTELTEHVAVCHICERTFICDICSAAFKSLKTVRRHIKRVHFTEKTHLCSNCDSKFKDKKTLAQHVLIHSGVKPYLCDICSRAFAQIASLSKHMIIHTDGKDRSPAVTCKDCLNVLANRRALVEHRFAVHKSIYSSWKKASKGFQYFKKDQKTNSLATTGYVEEKEN